MAEYLITDEHAGRIRGELCEKHGAQWLHHYHRAIEDELLEILARTVGGFDPQAAHAALAERELDNHTV